MRKVTIATDEYYHVYNRGVEKRTIVQDVFDVNRFMQSIVEFNTILPIGSIHENHYQKENIAEQLGNGVSKSKPLVEFVAYCLNPNHFHFLIRQVADKGIEQFMQRLGSGYTKYFNNRYKRVGSLFQGPFKAIHVENDEYLLHLSAYINLNNLVHKLGSDDLSLHRSSWNEYTKQVKQPLCTKEIILERFSNADEYAQYANDAVLTTINGRASEENLGLYSE